MKRKPNTKCSVCGKEIYRRPKEIENGNTYCSRTCCGFAARKYKKCKSCNNEFNPDKTTASFCSRACSNKGRTGIKYGKSYSNASQGRLQVLRKKFNFMSCMIEGCDYSKTFDIHRHVSGKDGGKYEIGNMFAICPLHHAEITRKIIAVTKVNDCVLRIL